MKVFKDGCHCFTCNKSWDIFEFVQDVEKCDFKTAFISLGGTYTSHETKASKILSQRRFKALNEAKLSAQKDTEKIKKELSFCIDLLNTVSEEYEPFSDEWCDAQNYLPVVFSLWEEILEGRGVDNINAYRKCNEIRKRFLAIG